MGCIPAPACKAALAQATRRWPGRRTTSDGICSSPKHQQQNPNSDHDYGLAFDLSHDPDHGVDTYLLADLLRRHPDKRIKYVISNGRIWNPSISKDWRTYVGSNPHSKHMHVSVLAKYRDDTSDWWAPILTEAPKEDVLMRDEGIIVVPPPVDGRQLVGHFKDNRPLGKFTATSSAQVCASASGDITKLMVQPTRLGDALVLAVAMLDGSPAPVGAEARVVIEHR